MNDYANDDLRPTSPSSDDDHMEEKTDSFKEDAELYLPCFVLMLDILLKQVCSTFRIP